MKATTANCGEDLVVRVLGDVDHHTSLGLREEIDRQMTAAAPRRLVLDLSGTEFMDSSGLGLILGRYRKAREAGCELVLLRPTPAILRILRLAGVDGMLTIRQEKGEES
ncbi:MAG: STAS domain-containing protein [Clostridia bacterium]|nr:STAS domain-containing protein [Clostridia bacterium]